MCASNQDRQDPYRIIPSHFGSRAISAQVNIVAVSDHVFHRFPFDLLIQVSATQLSLFLCIPPVFMADGMQKSLPVSPTPLSSNLGSPDGSAPDLDRVGVRSASSIEERRRFSQARLASISIFVQGFTRFESSILSLTQSAVTITNKIANVEQVVDILAARVVALETSAASASSISGSARSWPSPGPVDGSAATGSHGPGSSDDNRNTRRRLDTFSNPGFRVNNSMLACLHGSMSSLQRLTYQHTICSSGFIVKKRFLFRSACI